FILAHAAVSASTARETAAQIRVALRDVPATNGNELTPVLQRMLDVSDVLDRIGTDLDQPTQDTDLRRRIAALEAEVARLTTALTDADAARDAAQKLSDHGFIPAFRKGAGTAAGAGSVALLGIAVPSTLLYFLGADHPAMQALLTVLGRLPES
ncbi:MAG: DUF1192 family protein, partial [Pseudomonadota bacterium]